MRTRWHTLLMITTLGMACTGDVVATVGKIVIARSEVSATAALLATQRDPVFLSSREQQAKFVREVVNTLIDQHLVQSAAHAAGIQITPDELHEYLDAHKGRYSEASFHEMLSQRGINEAAWRAQRERQLYFERYVTEVIAPALTVTETAIATYYQVHRAEFQIRDAVRARQILVADRTTADAVRKRLLNGENFAQLAVEFSIAPEAEQGGDVGWIERGQYPAVFEATCFRLPVGAMSEVVQSPYGFHLFKVLERRRAAVRLLAEVATEIRERLQREASAEALTAQLAALRKATTIVIHDDAIDRVVVPRIVPLEHATHATNHEGKE